MRAVATDGHRLARYELELPAGAEQMPGVIIPRKTVAELRKLLGRRRRGDSRFRCPTPSPVRLQWRGTDLQAD